MTSEEQKPALKSEEIRPPADEIESTAVTTSHGKEQVFDSDDIHAAALADAPLHAQRPSVATFLSIFVMTFTISTYRTTSD